MPLRTRGERGWIGKLKRFSILISAGAVLLWLVNILFISDSFLIQSIQVVEGGKITQGHPIESLLKDFKNSNLILLNTNELIPILKKELPQYETLKIRKKIPDTLMVILETYPPIANLIVKNKEDGKEKEYLLNTVGMVVEGKNQKALPVIQIEREGSVRMGSTIMSQERLAFALEAIQSFEEKFGMKIIHGVYFNVEREFHLWTQRKFYIWLDMTSDLDYQLNKLKQALPKLNIYEENLDYIDLRISGINGEKIIFKRTE